jgi:hypothetical protein
VIVAVSKELHYRHTDQHIAIEDEYGFTIRWLAVLLGRLHATLRSRHGVVVGEPRGVNLVPGTCKQSIGHLVTDTPTPPPPPQRNLFVWAAVAAVLVLLGLALWHFQFRMLPLE